MIETLAFEIAALPLALKPQAAPGTWECALRQLPSTESVLNAGAGRGGLSWLLNKAGLSITSVDLHPNHFVAEGLACEFADLTHTLPFADASFDTVLAVEVAEHLENPWLFMREAIRVLVEGPGRPIDACGGCSHVGPHGVQRCADARKRVPGGSGGRREHLGNVRFGLHEKYVACR